MTLGLVMGVLAIGSPAAQASHTISNDTELFMPEGNFTDKDQLSDAFDGTDSAAHLTAIADPDSTQATFYVCDAGITPGFDPSTNNDCVVIGTDNSATVPAPDAVDADFVSAAAFDVFWNIPATFDSATSGNNYDIFARSCSGAPSATDNAGVPANCSEDVAADVYLDDAATQTGCGGPGQPACNAGSGQQLPTGEITSVCYDAQDTATPAAGDVCTAADFQATAGDHGSIVPADNFSVRFRTSADVDNASACLDTAAGLTTQPNSEDLTGPTGCNIYATRVYEGATVTGGTTTTADDYKEWTAVFEGTGLTADDDADLAIFGDGDDPNTECVAQFATAGGSPDAAASSGSTGQVFGATICVFDEHYVVARARTGESIVGTFLAGTPTATCDNPDSAETNRLDDGEDLLFCVIDQFGSPINGEDVTIQMDGVGTLECDGWSGTNESAATPSNGETQYCTDTSGNGFTAGNGEVNAFLSNDDDATPPTAGQRTDTTGNSVVVACLNDEAATATTFGCDDEAAADKSNTLTKTWVGKPDHLHLVFTGTGTASDPCHTGDKFKTNAIGDQEGVTVCVFDDEDNLVSTLNTGNSDEDEDEYAIDWSNSNPDAVAFASNPPTETTQTGTATLTIQAIAKGSATLTVFDTGGNLDLDSGPDSDSVTKSVTGEGTAQPQCNDNADNDGDGQVDYPNDPGCASVDDNSESPDPSGQPQCNDGVDNDGDGLIDFPNDPQCDSQQDNVERSTKFVRHSRTVEITRFRHIRLGNGKGRALLVAGRAAAPGYRTCKDSVPVKIQIRAGGTWITRKSDTTNGRGGFKVLIRDIAAKYRAVLPKFRIVNDVRDRVDVCLRAVSPGRRHRH
jgi:hypothetical protein